MEPTSAVERGKKSDRIVCVGQSARIKGEGERARGRGESWMKMRYGSHRRVCKREKADGEEGQGVEGRNRKKKRVVKQRNVAEGRKGRGHCGADAGNVSNLTLVSLTTTQRVHKEEGIAALEASLFSTAAHERGGTHKLSVNIATALLQLKINDK